MAKAKRPKAKMREGQTLELKNIWNDNACKTVCAFANTEGGKLYLGYDDNGSLVGLKNAKADTEDIPNTIRNKLGIFVSIYSGQEDGKEYIEITVPAMDRPIFYEGKIYIRVGSTNQLLDESDAVNFLIRKSSGSWDACTEPNVAIDDLDAESFKILLDDGIRNKRLTEYDRSLSRQELLEKLSLIKEGKLTRAAILLFHPHPEFFYGGAHIKLGYFSVDNQLRYQDELYGSLFSLAKKAEELLVLKYFYATIDYDGLVRVETLPYPREAVREGLLNALMHNDYRHAQPIAVRVTPVELWISNKCVFPAGWTEETLFAAHESKQLNPNVAAGFFRAGLVERFGTGIQKIVESCKRNGNPRPRFSIEPDMIRLTMPSRHENIRLVSEGATLANEGATLANEGAILASDGATLANDGENPGNETLKAINDGATLANDGEKPKNEALKAINDGANPANEGAILVNEGVTLASDGEKPKNETLKAINEGAIIANDGANPANDSLKAINEGATLANDEINHHNEGVSLAPATKQQKAIARKKSILSIMHKNSSVTAAKLASALNVSVATIERDLSYLKASGCIARSGSDKAGQWVVLKEL